MSRSRETRGGEWSLRSEEGQSLLETAFAMPLVLGIGFNLINISYFWIVLLALSAAPRQGVEYATQGGSALASVSAPGTAAISNLVYDNVTNALKGATTSSVSVQVCSVAKGVTSSTGVAQCDQFGPSYSFSGPAADPEQPVFVLDRVDVAFTVTPVIEGLLFNIVLPSNLTFHRQVSMRSLF
jgi:hypothetical protein